MHQQLHQARKEIQKLKDENMQLGLEVCYLLLNFLFVSTFFIDIILKRRIGALEGPFLSPRSRSWSWNGLVQNGQQ